MTTQVHDLVSDTSIFKSNNENVDLCPAKFESFYPEQLASPNSTEYTDDLSEAPIEVQRYNSDSRFYEEISSFEPIIDLASQVECDFKIAFRDEIIFQKESKSEKIAILESTDQSSHDDASSMNEEVEEQEELESLESKNWNDKKDKILKNLAAKCKYDWKKIAKKFNANESTEMTPVELKQRYKELTKVSIPLRVKFTHQEDLMIARYFDIYGCDWTQIATHFTDRTAMMLKNRYYSHIRKKNLLNSMLEEANEIQTSDKKEEAPAALDSKKGKSENFNRSSDDEFFFSFNRFPVLKVNSAFYEFEDPFQNILHERISDF